MKYALTCLALAAAVAIPGGTFAQTSDTLTLTSYNIHSAIPDGHNSQNYWPEISDLKNVADVLTTAGAEVIALQEVRNLWGSKKPGQYPLNFPLYLAGLLDMEYAFGSGLNIPEYTENREYLEWGNADTWTNNGAQHGEYGNAILSKLPLKWPPELVKLPRGTDERAKELTDEPRTALRVELKDEIPGLGRVIIYGTHFQHNNADTRMMQVRHLVDRAAQDLQPGAGASTTTVFLMGDFNHHPLPDNDAFLDVIKEGGFHDLAAVYAEKTGTKPHYTAAFLRKEIRIDYIFCSRPVDVLKSEVLKTSVSDHLPLTVTVKAAE